jgi:hypothetical protein
LQYPSRGGFPVPVTRAEPAFGRILKWFSLPVISRPRLPTVNIASTEHKRDTTGHRGDP